MEYRLTQEHLLNTLSHWNHFLKRKIHLIACGGTALTLLGVKSSTKDVDFLVPQEKEYFYLIEVLKQLGYEQRTSSGWKRPQELYLFDLFRGSRIHTTELLESPLEKENHRLIKEFQYLYIGTLNLYDLLISKLFRGAAVDFEDCLALVKVKRGEIDLEKLNKRFQETARFDISEERILKNLESFNTILQKEKLT